MEYINLTPHAVTLNNGTEYRASGKVARVSTRYSELDDNDIATVQFNKIVGLPDAAPDTIYIVSGMVSCAAGRHDVVSPATAHCDAVRDKNGFIISVPFFVRQVKQ